MTWKERIESNIFWFSSSLVILGFVAGFSAQAVLAANGSPSTETPWQQTATNAGWIPKGECSAYPVTISVTAPGTGATVSVQQVRLGSYASTDFVIQATRPLPEQSSVGLIFNEGGDANFYVTFPSWEIDDKRQIFRRDDMVLPLQPSVPGSLNVWAVIADDQRKFGTVYSSIEQIMASAPDVIISSGVSVATRGR